jgi:hypothetical protein
VNRRHVVYHQSCGHVAGISEDRSVLEAGASAMAAAGQFAWRVRVERDGDLEALMRGDRCAACTQDGVETAVPA